MALEFTNNPLNQRLISISNFMIGSPENATASFTFWVKMTAFVNAIEHFFGMPVIFGMEVANTGIVKTRLYTEFGGVTSITAMSVGVWYFIAGTGERDGTNCTTEVYINGVFEATKDDTDALSPSTDRFHIGNEAGAPNTQGLNGTLDDLRTYSRVLSAKEIRTIYTARGHDAITDGLIQRVQFMEGPPATSPSGVGFNKDVSRRKLNYTPTGSPLYRVSTLSKRRRLIS